MDTTVPVGLMSIFSEATSLRDLAIMTACEAVGGIPQSQDFESWVPYVRRAIAAWYRDEHDGFNAEHIDFGGEG